MDYVKGKIGFWIQLIIDKHNKNIILNIII